MTEKTSTLIDDLIKIQAMAGVSNIQAIQDFFENLPKDSNLFNFDALNLARALRFTDAVICLGSLQLEDDENLQERLKWVYLYHVLQSKESNDYFENMEGKQPLKVVVKAIVTDEKNSAFNDCTGMDGEWLSAFELAFDFERYDLALSILEHLISKNSEKFKFENYEQSVLLRLDLLNSKLLGIKCAEFLIQMHNLLYQFHAPAGVEEKNSIALKGVEIFYEMEKYAEISKLEYLEEQFKEKAKIQTYLNNAHSQQFDYQELSKPLKLPDSLTETDIMKNWPEDWSKPEVTIFCLTYNHVNYIEDCLAGFLLQETNFSFNIIIHDDASNDGTSDILRKYKSKYPNIIYLVIQEKNLWSQGKPYEHSLADHELVWGKYRCNCEGDDYWVDTEKIQKQYEYLENNLNISVTFHDSILIDGDGCVFDRTELSFDFKRDFNDFELMTKQAWISLRTTMYRNLPPMPKEKYSCYNGDSFLSSVLGEYGGSHFHRDIKPAVYRMTRSGVWAGLSEQERLEKSLSTELFLYYYHRRKNRMDVAEYFWVRLFQKIFHCQKKYHPKNYFSKILENN